MPTANATAGPVSARESSTSPFVPGVQRPEPFTLIIFGALGDLATHKLLPALHGLWSRGFLPEDFAIVGVGRREMSDDAFRKAVSSNLAEHGTPDAKDSGNVAAFLTHLCFHRADFTKLEGAQSLADHLQVVEKKLKLPGNRLYYMAIDPDFFSTVIELLSRVGLICRDADRPWCRIVIEKPFGHDLASALELDRRVMSFLRPDQAYRIDHYLGKETVQNLMAFRFGNAIFEPLFHREFVEHVQITVAETVGVEKRGAFYDHAGALRDVVQNHLLQLLALIAMDPPATLTAGDISDSKLKVLRTLQPFANPAEVARRVVRGQYGPGTFDGRPVPGYREEESVARDSTTETYVAMRTELESWRWAGVPFLLRTGKRLPRRVTEIAVQFKLPPMRLFRTVECEGDFCDLTGAAPTVLAFRIQPDEGITLSFSAKRPGMQLFLEPVRFEFNYGTAFHQQPLPEAYERLLLDALRGDATLFMRSDELEAAWAFVTPILEAWRAAPGPAFPNYAAGTWGPDDAGRLIAGCHGGWREPGSAQQGAD